MPGLFGPTPGEIQASRGDRRLNRLSQFGQIPLGTLGGGMAGLLAGEAFQDATGGSPELKRATLLQEAQQEVMQSGLSPGEPGYRDQAVQALLRRGLANEASQAQIAGLEAEKLFAETRKAEQGFRREASLATSAEAAAATAPQTEAFKLQKLVADTFIAKTKAGALPEQQKAELANIKARSAASLASASASRSQAARTRAGIRIDEMTASTRMMESLAKAKGDEINDSVKLLDRWRSASQLAREAEDGWARFQALASLGTSASDTGLLVAYTKMLDPRSAAQKGEVDAVADAMSGILGRISKQVRNSGSTRVVLTPEERALLTQAAQALAQTNAEKFNAVNKQYEGLATRLQVKPENVVLQQPTPVQGGAQPATGGGQVRRKFNPATGQLE